MYIFKCDYVWRHKLTDFPTCEFISRKDIKTLYLSKPYILNSFKEHNVLLIYSDDYCCCITLVLSDSVRPHRQQPTRLLCPWDSPGKNTGVGCHFLLHCMKVKSESEVAQSCPTPSDPWTLAYQAPPSLGFSRQKYWSGVPLSLFISLILVIFFLIPNSSVIYQCFCFWMKPLFILRSFLTVSGLVGIQQFQFVKNSTEIWKSFTSL